jgi:hypothetical protein
MFKFAPARLGYLNPAWTTLTSLRRLLLLYFGMGLKTRGQFLPPMTCMVPRVVTRCSALAFRCGNRSERSIPSARPIDLRGPALTGEIVRAAVPLASEFIESDSLLFWRSRG